MAEKEKEQDSKRWNYIGFEVFPGKVKDFWGNSDEERTFRERSTSGRAEDVFEREDSVLFKPIMSETERVILMIIAALTVVSLIFPWFRVTHGFAGDYTEYTINAIGFIGVLPFLGSLGAWGTGLELPSLIIIAMYMFVTPIIGIAFLITLAGMKKNPAKKYSMIKTISRLFGIPILLFFTILILASIGFPMPFGNLGVREVGESFNLLSFLSMAGIGFYAMLAGALVCSLMAAEL